MENLIKLKNDTASQPEILKVKASALKEKLKELGMLKIVEHFEASPNILDYFGANPEDLVL